MGVPGCPEGYGGEEVCQEAEEERHVLGDELGQVHVSEGFHEQHVLVLVQVVAFRLPGRPVGDTERAHRGPSGLETRLLRRRGHGVMAASLMAGVELLSPAKEAM